MQPRQIALSCLIALAPSLAYAELDCIVPTREEGFEPQRPGAEAIRRAARAAAEITRKNAVFMAGDNKPVRVRTTINYYGLHWVSASVITVAYNKQAWLAGGCKVSKFADRGRSLSDGQIALYINDPEALLGGQIGDAELRASFAPRALGELAGFPTYAVGGDTDNARVLLSAAAYRPWTAVTAGELLARQERDLQRAEAQWRDAQQPSTQGLDEAKIEQMYQDLKKVNAAEAEKLRAKLLASLPKMQADAARQSTLGSATLSKRRAAFDAYRASLTPAQLQAPGTLSTQYYHAGMPRVDDANGKPLAKIDPRYAQRDPARIHLIAVSLARPPKTDPEYKWQIASYEAIDLAALAALTRP